MTRRDALQAAARIVERSRTPVKQKREILEKLALCENELPFARWSREAIFDACDDFIQQEGRSLTTADFARRDMPSHTVIQNRFGMTARAFRDAYYMPGKTNFGSPRSRYRSRPVSFWNERFAEEYHRIRPTGQRDFNQRRSREVPSWATVARMNGLTRWLALLDHLGLERCPRDGISYCFRSFFPKRPGGSDS